MSFLSARLGFASLAMLASLVPPLSYVLFLAMRQRPSAPPQDFFTPPTERSFTSVGVQHSAPKVPFDPKAPNPFAVRPPLPVGEVLFFDVEFGPGGATNTKTLLQVVFTNGNEFFFFPLHKPDGTVPDLAPLQQVLSSNRVYGANPEAGDCVALNALGLDTQNVRDVMKLRPIGSGTGTPGPSLKTACVATGVTYYGGHAMGEVWSLYLVATKLGMLGSL